MRPVSKELGEICYPFIYEDSPVCDFEITADELCSRIGLVLSMELDDFSRDILTRMQPNVYHVNGSIRGKLAITEAEVDELKADYDAIKARIDGGFKGFVLPGGHPTSSQLHLCRCQAKKVFVHWLPLNIQVRNNPLRFCSAIQTCSRMCSTVWRLTSTTLIKSKKLSLCLAATQCQVNRQNIT